MNEATRSEPTRATLTPWRSVPLYWLGASRVLTDAERLPVLAGYRATGSMYDVVMAEPGGSDSPEEYERLSEAGPDVEEIDWSGFPGEDDAIVLTSPDWDDAPCTLAAFIATNAECPWDDGEDYAALRALPVGSSRDIGPGDTFTVTRLS